MIKKRWGYAALCVIVMLFAGLLYAWSVLSLPIAAYFPELSTAELSFTFTLAMMFFCIGGLIAGLLSKKVSPKLLLLATGLCFGLGFFMSSKADSLLLLYIGYGVFAGLGSGLAYNVIMGISNKWFADMPGLISGIVLMGFGFGSFFIGKIYQAFTPSGAGVDAFRTSFLVLAVLLVAVMVVAAFFLRGPKPEEEAEIQKLVALNKGKKVQVEKGTSDTGEMKTGVSIESRQDFSPAQMLKTGSFWIFFVWATLLTGEGLILISQASGIAFEVNPGFAPGTVSTIVGLISIFNGGGRVMFGRLYDKAGQRKTMLLVELIFTVGIILLGIALAGKSTLFLTLGFIVMGIGYGGVTPTNSAFTNDFFGSRYYAINLPIVTLNLLISSFSSTIAGALYDVSQSYYSSLVLLAGLVVVGLLATLFIRRPKVK